MSKETDRGTLALTAAQTAVWLAQELDPTNPLYRAAEAVEIDGPLDVELLEVALRQAVAETDAVRARFDGDGRGRMWQTIEPVLDWSLPQVDLRGAADPEAAAEEWMWAELGSPVDLRRSPLFSFAVLRTGQERFTVYVAMHHILMDGFGFALFIQRVAELYRAAEEGQPFPPCQFGSLAQLISDEAEYDESERYVRDRQYWAEHLVDWPKADRSSSPASVVPHTFLRETGHVTPEDTAGLRALARKARTSLPSVAMSALALYVHRLAGTDEVVLDLTVNGRSGSFARSVPSMVTNVLPLRTLMTPSTTVAELIRTTSNSAKGLLRHQRYSSAHLVRDLGIAHHRGGYLGDWGMNIMTHDAQLQFGRHPAVLRNLSNGPVTGLGVNVYDRPADGSLRIDFNSDPDKYDGPTTAAHLRRFLQLLHVLANADPEQQVGAIDLLSEDERELVLDRWNDTEHDTPEATVPELFEAQVRAEPDATALVCGETRLSAAELNTRANRLAHLLIERGAGPETRIALALPRTADYLIAVMAVLKAGATCVPLDPGHPPARIQALLAETRPSHVLTTSAIGATLPSEHPFLVLDEVGAEQPGTDPVGTHRPEHAAYISFTSGSTGGPKGVVVEHRQLANLFHDHRRELIEPAGRRLRAAVTASFSFDTAWESVLFLAAGQEVHFIDDQVRLDPAALVRYFARHRIDFVDLTPSFLRRLLPEGLLSGPEKFPWLLMVGGEPIDPALWSTLRDCPGIEAWNYYGPTESTVDSVYCRVEGDRPLIGRPGHNVRAYVLDAAMQPQPPGVPGELYLGGAQVAREYLNREELTAQHFLPDPFGRPGARMYRTGDLARWTEDGMLEYLGRTDDQLKIRGVRIEPGEIEAALTAHPRVAEAVVAATTSAEPELVAYVVPRAEPVDAVELRSWTAKRLPTSMVPSSFVLLPELPLTVHGKLDHSALPAPEARAGRAPRTQREEQLCALFAEVLGVEEVTIDDDFFELGGQSLRAAELVTRLRTDLNTEVLLGAVYEAPTVAELVELLDRETSSNAFEPVLPLRTSGTRPPLFCVHPMGGLSWCYAGLPRHLPEDVPVYGLQSIGLTRAEELPSTFREMVDGYVRQIRSVQPTGPYHLLGWSLGGALAHAIAARLQADGERVALLALLDSRPVDPQVHRVEFGREDVRSLLLEAAGLPSGAQDHPALGEEQITALTTVLLNSAALLPTYAESLFHGDLLYFRAAAADELAHGEAWNSRITGAVISHDVECTHDAITQAEPMAVIGGLIAEHLQREPAVVP
ncbi:amino acid adenylation domain-containing protein [Saccharopolyspora sp. WRP15-2]|uniref:Amino acid adenylation domain-containing protein n=1 Tax=Saccharopolyspora oryzae TaxID=2997343 RepID=A0ABT4USP8_9PSEU|nr:amino acid adenylation domain-containing protein [Saccharopolyspora oryzae]MDA3624741.1 amino acid adenylation domain-containing protein [Saccharopolyspora oryzae]